MGIVQHKISKVQQAKLNEKAYEVKQNHVIFFPLSFGKSFALSGSLQSLPSDIPGDSLPGLWCSHLQSLLVAHFFCSLFAFTLILTEGFAVQYRQALSTSLPCKIFCCFGSNIINTFSSILDHRIPMCTSAFIVLLRLAVQPSITVPLYQFHWLAYTSKPHQNHCLSQGMFLSSFHNFFKNGRGMGKSICNGHKFYIRKL